MKQKLLFSMVAFCFTISLLLRPNLTFAVKAYPYPMEYKQPDGSKITIILKGDEKVKWAETLDGYSLVYNKEGFLVYAILDKDNNMVPSDRIAKQNRSNADKNFLKNVPKHLRYNKEQISIMKQIWNIYADDSTPQRAFPTTGNRSLICILIGFTDLAFSKNNAEFSNLFNQVGYVLDNALGSVKDYFLEASYNQFTLTVDVAGPYTASNNMAYYGANDPYGNDVRPRELVQEACNLANPTVNFANYDNDNDGYVDAVYVIYAGYGEEAGGPANAIWAHAWNLSPALYLDGKYISRYSCSAELRGNSGSGITRIGVICHEFGHVLGAPDYYDTDYSTNGQYDGTGEWDLQADGSWNGGTFPTYAGRAPAHPNPFTKCYTYNWASPTTISTGMNITMQNSTQNSNQFYRYNTTTSNEYFLCENRQQVGFDSYVPGHGLIIYHVDGDYIASHTYNNDINAGSHQGLYPVCANATGNPPTTYGTINGGGCPFPGTGNKTSFTDATTPHSKSWAGANTNKPITAITENSGIISFTFMGGSSCTPPTTQATNFSATAIGDNQMTINWTRGNGNQVLVVARQGSAVNTDPTNGTSYTANATFGSGDQIGTGNYVVYKGTGTNVTVTGLTSGTAYHYAIYEFNTTDNCYKTPPLTGNATTTGAPPCTYCTSSGNTTYETSITLVNFNTINNTSAKPSGYSDYTAISTTVTKNSSYNLTVNVNTDGAYTVHARAWIDWNKDCDFDDPGEQYDLGYATNVTNGITNSCPYSILVPTTATVGTTRMRVSCQYYAAPTSCLTGFDGEVEDYSIVVQASGGSAPVANFSANNLNPTVGQTVTFTDLSTNNPTSWAWSFSPTSVTYVGGTNANSQNPQVQFNAAGTYNVTLVATNANGSGTETKNGYINVTSSSLTLIYDNGNFITHTGAGAGGANVSALQTDLSMSAYGSLMNNGTSYKVADNANLHDDSIYIVKQLKFFGYQTITSNPNPTTSTFTGLYFRVWNGNPSSGGTLVYDYSSSNMMTSTVWSGTYRTLITALTNTDRSIMEIICTLPANDSLVLTGTNDYWIDWATTGSATSGPWANPLTVLGQTTTGDAIQWNGTSWAAIIDAGTSTPQGLPFKLYGRRISALIPTLSVTPSTLSFGNQTVGTTSTAQTYTLTGSNLTANVTITAPTGFEISLNGTTYATTQTVTPTGGNVNQTVYVRFAPTAVQSYTGNVSNASTGATTQNVAVSGTGIAAPTPTLSVNPTSLSFGDVVVGTTSSAQTYTLTGNNLTANVTITAPTGFEISLNGTTYATAQTVTPSGGNVSQTVYVRFAPTAVQNYTGNVSNTSTGATTQNVAVTGNGISASTPTLAVTPNTINFGNQTIGTTSTAQTYNLTGAYLTSDVFITAPTGFEISLNGTTFSSALSITPVSGNIAQSIYVRFVPTIVQSYSGNIANISTGANTQNVAVSGNGTAPVVPTLSVNPSSLNFGDVITGTTSTAQTYTLTGSDLTANVSITAPTGFEISLNGTTYATTQTVTPSGGNVSQTVYVRFTPTAVQNYTGNVSNASAGATTQNVAVSGNGVSASTPILNAIPNSLDFGSVNIGSTSSAQTYQLTGSNLTAIVNINAPAGFEISLDGTSYGSSQSITPTSGNVNQTVYVRFAPPVAQNYSGNIVNSSTGASNRLVAVTGIGTSPVTPEINVNPSTLDFGNIAVGSVSSPQTYNLTGTNLIDNITITATSGFEVSLNGTTYSSTATALQSGGNVNQTIYVRFAPIGIGSYTSLIINASTGATTKMVNVNGNGTGINDLTNELGMQIYPNPAKENVNIQFHQNLKNVTIVISDIYGKTINTFTATQINEQEVKTIDVSKLAKGMYMLTIKVDGTEKQIKLMVE